MQFSSYLKSFLITTLITLCLSHEWPDWERERWLNHMNIRLNKASKTIIEDDVFSKASIAKYIELMTKHLKLPGIDFYRDEFRYCDRDSDDMLSRTEVLYCGNIATTLINRHLLRDLDDPAAYMPQEHIFSINMTKLQVRTQIDTGLNFEQFYKLKIFLAMIFGRALYYEHDNYANRRNHYVCSSEWHDVQNGMRSIFPGYTEADSWVHFEEFDMNRSLALEEYELYFYFDSFWKRWFLSHGTDFISKY